MKALTHIHTFGPIKDLMQTCESCGETVMMECTHLWETIRAGSISQAFDLDIEKERIFLKCKHCGDIKILDV